MSDQPAPRRRPTVEEQEREDGRRNVIKTVGLTAFGLGLVGILISIVDLVRAVVFDVDDGELHYAWLFFCGLGVLVVGWWFLLAGYQARRESISIDCARCGAINDADAEQCRLCGGPLD